MNKILGQLQPEILWNYFEEICQIPRPSKKEEKIRAFLQDFAKKQHLESRVDEAGNVIISKPATPGKENVKPVVLQSHMDMVCEKNSGLDHNFITDPIRPAISGEWVKATGTTLGADDGIGIAAQLAILSAGEIEHGPLECLFTVDEETGLTGAFALQPGFINGRVLLNLDSEDEGQLFIGCAGGMDTVATFTYKEKKMPKGHIAFKIEVKGLKGGHSGDDIDKGHGNSNKILNRLCWDALEKFKIRLTVFDGGNLRNAIPREAYAIISMAPKWKTAFEQFITTQTNAIKTEWSITEPDLTITYAEVEPPALVINQKLQRKLMNALYGSPHGVITMSQKMPGMVETSTNLASVKFNNKERKIVVATSQRSDSNTEKIDVAHMVESVFRLAGARVVHSEGYPGWTPNPASEVLHLTVDAYRHLFDNEPVVRSIHAGLECGLFLEKYHDMDMVSFGPTLRGVHSPDERINIESVKKFWDLLIEVLRRMPAA
jgi:dipeptidase D